MVPFISILKIARLNRHKKPGGAAGLTENRLTWAGPRPIR
jgi:hypothetical protein